MNQLRLYQNDVYQDSNEAEVLEILSKDGFDVLVTDQSVFFPEGGGQPSDCGYVERGDDVYAITTCYDEDLDGPVYHVTNAPAGTFAVGDKLNLAIDWDVRFTNMQRHLGEHMLSGAFHNLFGGINRGFHMGETYITIDIEREGGLLTQEEIDLAETMVNWNIWMDLPVTTTWFDTYEESRVMPVRKDVPHDGRVSVVTVGSLEEPFDCIACCGTHPSSTAQVGLLTIYKHEPNKGMTRIYFDCGAMALRKLEEDANALTQIANSRSCSNQDLLARLEQEDARSSELRARLAACSSYIKEHEKAGLLDLIANSDSVVSYSSELLETNDLLKLGFDLVASLGPSQLLCLMDMQTSTLLLYSNGELACGDLVKKHIQAYNGKGGGRPDNARASFASNKDMKNFVEFLKEIH